MSAKDTAPSVHIRSSQLSRARGLGSAKLGSHHWWAQRLTAIALLPLALYFVVSVIILRGADHAAMAAYMGEPWNAVLFLCLIAALYYHFALGIQVVIEDYIRTDSTRIATLLVVRGAIIFLALASAVSVLKLAF